MAFKRLRSSAISYTVRRWRNWILAAVSFAVLNVVIINVLHSSEWGLNVTDEQAFPAPVIQNNSFLVSEAAKLWDAEVGCESFRERHRDVINAYSNGGPESWLPSGRFQNWSSPSCDKMKLKHVVVHFAKPAWLVPNWLEGMHVCHRCGITCQFSWSSVMADKPDARVYVELNLPPRKKSREDPLRVYLSVEPENTPWTNIDKNADISIGYGATKDVQLTYARPRESRQHYISPVKRQDVVLFRATSNCLASWRNNLTASLLAHIPHHSFGACDNNVGGRGREIDMYPHCQFVPSRVFGGQQPVHWQEMAHCLLSHYKFSLAFENSKLPGYVTEKIFLPLEAGTVPIYIGAPDVKHFVPPESYIAGDDFNSTASLADYILELHQDPVRYMSYFAWRRCGVLGHLIRSRTLSLDSLPCRLCERISSMGGKESD